MDFSIEPMIPSDWSQVRTIYQEGIATGQATLETPCQRAKACWQGAVTRRPSGMR